MPFRVPWTCFTTGTKHLMMAVWCSLTSPKHSNSNTSTTTSSSRSWSRWMFQISLYAGWHRFFPNANSVLTFWRFSDWITLRGGRSHKAHGSGRSFLSLLLMTCLCTNILMTDSTLTEIIVKDTAPGMQCAVDALGVVWDQAMNVNCKKTEMVVGRLSKESVTQLWMTTNPLHQVSQYKLLGVIINTCSAEVRRPRQCHNVKVKAAKRLWFLKIEACWSL